ncbi:MAG: gap protein [Mycobacterium sp.]|nr:gap protein [Mycobacterium sp.]
MWSSLLGLGFVLAFEPLRIGVVLLLISRPRPVQNLFALWIAAFSVGVSTLLVPLIILHGTPRLDSFAEGLPTNSTVRHFQIGMGAFTLLMAVLIAVRSLTRARQRARLLTPGSGTSTTVLDSPRAGGRHRAAELPDPPTAISRILSRAQDAATEGKSPIGRLIGRVYNAWENGSPWVAFLIGLGPLPIETLVYVLAIVAPSGAALSTQVGASIVFIVVLLAVVEIALVSYLIMPTKTQSVLQVLHDWIHARRTQVVVAMFAVGGLAMVASGLGIGIGSVRAGG